MTNPESSVNRQAYRSPLRGAQAAATRAAIIRAAAALFVERGFGATSIDAIAEAAGVGRATVFSSVGGKAALLRAAYDVALVGDDDAIPLPERPWARNVREAATQRDAIQRYADGITDYGGRVAPIYEALRGAASLDPDVRETWIEIRKERRGGAAKFVKVLTTLGPLRAGVEARTAGDIVWVLNDPGLYHQLVVEQRWQSSGYSQWLGETMSTQLLE